MPSIDHITFLESYSDQAIHETFSDHLSNFNVHNVFNPSFHIDGETEAFAFRAIPQGSSNRLESYLSIRQRGVFTTINLNERYQAELRAPKLDDPKIAVLDDGIYITFHTGWHPARPSDIYLMKILPELQPPRRVVYAGRKHSERNWAFFSLDGHLHCLYSLDPLRLLRLKEQGQASLVFEEAYNIDCPTSKGLSIGTQPILHRGEFLFIGHHKIPVEGKKLYLGRLIRFNPVARSISTGQSCLTHSLPSMLGKTANHNNRLYACTYFSGLQLHGDELTMSYGINDESYGFATLPCEASE